MHFNYGLADSTVVVARFCTKKGIQDEVLHIGKHL
jgi:hypothetical protein